MPTQYSAESKNFKPTTLPPEVMQSIGKLVRAFAEIDDLITLHICNLTGISQSTASILLGRTMGTTKLDIAHYLAKTRGEEVLLLHNDIFNDAYREIRKCRNIVAHGVLLGETDDGRFAFLTSDALPPTGDVAVYVAVTYAASEIEYSAMVAERSIPLVTARLGLSTFRERRFQRPLQPHRRAKNQQTNRKKPQPPPEPSPA